MILVNTSMDKTSKDYCVRMVKEIEIECVIEGLKQRGLQVVNKGIDLYYIKKDDGTLEKHKGV